MCHHVIRGCKQEVLHQILTEFKLFSKTPTSYYLFYIIFYLNNHFSFLIFIERERERDLMIHESKRRENKINIKYNVNNAHIYIYIYIYIATMYFYITLYGMIRVNFGLDWLKCDSYFIIQALMRVLLL